MKFILAVLIAASTPTLAGAQAQLDGKNSSLTQGSVQLNVKVGQTTKAEVLDVFGAPNITTRDGSGQEVWSYQRHATVEQSKEKSSFWTILLAGGSSKATGLTQSMRTMTLIIKFNAQDIVSDFRSRTSDF